jgi:hypothetical protein
MLIDLGIALSVIWWLQPFHPSTFLLSLSVLKWLMDRLLLALMNYSIRFEVLRALLFALP